MSKPVNEAVAHYWQEHYISSWACVLCGNSGVVDTTGVRTNAGLLVGGRHFCICRNGQIMRSFLSEPPK